ncbi:MAG: hypothetical protein HY901_00400 [Deltaproteobacteria bacterium]|nr:hypothetical protein [Deltaproteobacteria bacterium]
MARWRMPLLLVALAPLACGRTETFEARRPARTDGGVIPADAAIVDGGDPSPDAGPAEDAGSSACTAVEFWRLEPRALRAAFLSDAVTPRMGSTERLNVEVGLETACEEVARVEVIVMPGNATDFVTLSAFVWVREPERCEPAPRVAVTRVSIPGRQAGNGRVAIRDGHAEPGDWEGLSYLRSECPGSLCPCDSWAPGSAGVGQWCNSDCDCAAGLSCLAFAGPQGQPRWGCFAPCETGVDCAAAQGEVCGDPDGAPNLICVPPASCEPSPCPPGFRCGPGPSGGTACLDERHGRLEACDCDADCLPGLRCVLGLLDSHICMIPCATERDCPDDHTCRGVCLMHAD